MWYVTNQKHRVSSLACNAFLAWAVITLAMGLAAEVTARHGEAGACPLARRGRGGL